MIREDPIMVCSHCGNDIAEGSGWCQHCGTRVAAGVSPVTLEGAQHPAGAGAVNTAGKPAFSFNAGRLERTDWTAGIATIVVLISLFLPWFGVSVLGISGTADGLTVHGYLYLVLLVALAITAYLVLQAGFEELPFRLPLGHGQLMLGVTGLNFLLVVIAFLSKPALTSWQYGAFIGLAAALVAVAPLASSAIPRHRNAM
jgi:hypothetical protein